jgi:long-chain acyl-CoA synthetase
VVELLDDVLELKPTIFTSVPRLYNRIYDRVMSTIRAGNPLARRLFAAAYASKKAALQAGDLSGGRFGPFWDRLVFSKIKARLGGVFLACGPLCFHAMHAEALWSGLNCCAHS